MAAELKMMGMPKSKVYHTNMQCDSLRGVDPKKLIEVNGRRKCKTCIGGGKRTKKSPPKQTASSSSKIEYLECKHSEQTTPHYLFYDTEGRVEITEIGIVSMDKSFFLYEKLVAKQNGSNANSNAHTMKSVWQRVETETVKLPLVYLVANSGASHDETRLKAALRLENIQVDKRFKFVDSLDLFKLMIAPLEGGFKMDNLQKLVLGNREPISPTPGDANWIRHAAHYDAMLLRDVMRMVGGHMVLIDLLKASTSISAYIDLMGDSEIGCMHATTQLAKYKIPCRTYESINDYTSPSEQQPTQDLFLTRDGSKLHLSTCRFVQGIITTKADANELTSLSRCQVCCFKKT